MNNFWYTSISNCWWAFNNPESEIIFTVIHTFRPHNKLEFHTNTLRALSMYFVFQTAILHCKAWHDTPIDHTPLPPLPWEDARVSIDKVTSKETGVALDLTANAVGSQHSHKFETSTKNALSPFWSGRRQSELNRIYCTFRRCRLSAYHCTAHNYA